jgi:hypothetical protein
VIQVKNELTAMAIDMAIYAIENNIPTLPTGETPVELLGRISESLRESQPTIRRGRRKKEPEPEAAG